MLIGSDRYVVCNIYHFFKSPLVVGREMKLELGAEEKMQGLV